MKTPALPTACGPRGRPPKSVKAGEGRTRTALYKALSLAYDFAVAAQQNPDDYAELLEESGVKAQARAPMTPIVKLVFGIDYDKARLTEFAAALSFAQRQEIELGGFQDFIEKQPGGLKALVAAERQARRPEPKPDTQGRSCPRAAALRAADLARGRAGRRRIRGRRHPPRRRRHARAGGDRRRRSAGRARDPPRRLISPGPRGCPPASGGSIGPPRPPVPSEHNLSMTAHTRLDPPLVESIRKALTGNALPGETQGLSREAERDAAEFLARSPRARKPGELALAIQSTGGEAGNRRMRIGIVNDDMPFLVDSVANAVAARQLTIHRLLHPVVCVTRDATGELQSVEPLCGDKNRRESMMYLELDRADARGRQELAADLRRVLGDVRLAVRDWESLQRQMREDARADRRSRRRRACSTGLPTAR